MKREMTSIMFFVMIKPDGVKRGLVGEIVSRFEKKGFTLHNMKMTLPTENRAKAHYKEHGGKAFFDKLIKFTCSGAVVAMIWEGNIQVARNIVGATVPWEASKGTIRGDHACSMPNNLVHCSDSVESAQREISLWFE